MFRMCLCACLGHQVGAGGRVHGEDANIPLSAKALATAEQNCWKISSDP